MTDRPSERTVESLGSPIFSHASSRSNIVAGIILGLALICAGLALGWYRVNEIADGAAVEFQEQALNWLGVVALFGGGITLLVWMWMLFGFRLWVCPEGFYYTWNCRTHVFAWEEISEVRETIAQEPLLPVRGVAKRVTPTQARRSYRIRRCDGKTFSVGVNTLPHVSVLGGPLKAAAQRLDTPWHTEEHGDRPTHAR